MTARMLKRLQPIEWALLLFIAYVVARSGVSSFRRWEELALVRSVNIFAALLVVGTIHLLRRYRARTFTVAPTPRQRAVLDGTALAACVPLAASVYIRVVAWKLVPVLGHSEAADALAGLGLVILQVLSF